MESKPQNTHTHLQSFLSTVTGLVPQFSPNLGLSNKLSSETSLAKVMVSERKLHSFFSAILAVFLPCTNWYMQDDKKSSTF